MNEPYLQERYPYSEYRCMRRTRDVGHCIERFFALWRSFGVDDSSPIRLGVIREIAKLESGLADSQFPLDEPLGSNSRGVRCKDAESVTYPDEWFKPQITQGVMKKVLALERAYREIVRTRKARDAHVLMTPHVDKAKKSRRAANRNLDGRAEFLLQPPEYDGNRLNEMKALMTMKWGL